MKFLIISAALVAMAFATPVLVMPDITGPAPVIEDDTYESVNVGPAFVQGEEGIAIGPAIVDEAVNTPSSPIIQIIVNVNSESRVIDIPQIPDVVAPLPTPVLVPEDVISPLPTPVLVPDEVIIGPSPVEIGSPELPNPIPSPVIVANPELPAPAPAITLPEELN